MDPAQLVANLTEAIAELILAIGQDKTRKLVTRIIGDMGAPEHSAPEGGETPPEARPA